MEVHGEVSQSQKDASVHLLNNDPETRVLIGHPRSGGIGVGLASASYSIFFSKGFSLAESLQAESRNHRSGSEIHKSITRIDLVTENTIDEIISEKLLEKNEISGTVLQSIRGNL